MVTFIIPEPTPQVKARWQPRSVQPVSGDQRPSSRFISEKAAPVTKVKDWTPDSYQVPVVEGKTRFHDLKLPTEIMQALAGLRFAYCTPIQSQLLPHSLEGIDVTGRAQTGTGKTAAFLITIFSTFLKKPVTGKRRLGTPRALILAPTRELAQQIEKEAELIGKYTGFRTIAIYGGAQYKKQQGRLEKEPIDLVVATPGRLLDFKSRSHLHLNHVEILVIDEADRMLDMGFIPSVRQIIHSTPPRTSRQTMIFSATLTPDVIRLASQWMQNPVTVNIEPEQVTVDTVEQRVYIVTTDQKFALLYNILQQEKPDRVIIFANRRDEVARLCRYLRKYRITSSLLSGALTQKVREKTLEAFKKGQIKVLVATDVAGRGLHVEGISHVINYNMPTDPEDYVHRIGRTGRAGAKGISISFACEDDSFYIPDIEKYIGRHLCCINPQEEWLKMPAASTER